MRSRVVRVTLTLLAVAAIGTAAYSYWTTLARIDASLQRAASFTQARAAATHAAYDLRSAQQAYVAAGQNEAFWFERVTGALDALRTTLPVLEREAGSAAARAPLADVSAAVEEFDARDRRVRSYASSGQRLLAADIIFSDGLDLVGRIVAGLDSAAQQVAAETASARAGAVREQMTALGAAAGAAILIVLLLAATGSPGNVQVQDTHVQTPKHDGLLNLDLRPPAVAPSRESASRVRTAQPAGVAASAAKKAASTVKPATSPPPMSTASERPQVTSPPPLNLEHLAAICADLARLSNASTIPAILERAASALDASGLVLWIADAERGELLPIAAHGYAPNVLSRMGGLPAGAENATAGAFRTGLAQTVRGTDVTNGAIAAPLLSPAGPLGVLSLEMRGEGEKRPDRLAAATIVASQLATIVAPVEQSADRSIG